MSSETETRKHTASGEAPGRATGPKGEEPVGASAGGRRPEPEAGAEQPPYVRGETFVIEKSQAAESRNPSSSERPSHAEEALPLFDQAVAHDFRSRWNDIQVAFVDEPREAVRSADRLVSETIKQLTDSFTAGRQKLEEEWSRGGEDSTEALRLAFQRYRSYFNRLLSV